MNKAPDSPTVSVILCTYNHGHYITEAILSVFQQTFTSYECIVMNDGSTDDTVEKVEALIESYPEKKIKLINGPNVGVVRTRNKSVTHAQGRYMLFLDADDVLHPTFLSECVPVLESKPSVGFVYTDVQHIGYRNDIWSGGPFDPTRLLLDNQLTLTALMRKNTFIEIGGFKEQMEKGFEDWEMWISCVEAGWSGHHIDKPLFYYRKDEETSRLHSVDDNLDVELRTKIIALHEQLYRRFLPEIFETK